MLTAHLWKEWREQRVLLLGFVAVLVAIAVGFGLFAPAKLVPADAELWFVIVALGAGFVALAGDLVPGEQRRGQLAFLLRAPGGLRAAFTAKIVVLVVGLALLLAAGWALGELCLWLAGGRGLPERAETLGHASTAIVWIAAGVGVTAPWAFAVSCWLPRGASVLPATALTLAAVTAPPVLVGATYSVPVGRGEVIAAAVLLFAGGLIAAWLSFVRGLRFGRRPATVLNGLAAAAVFVLPSWVWSADRVWAWHHVDPTDRGVTITEALLGDGGRTAFVSLTRNWSRQSGPVYAVAVDLETGAWRQLGDAQGYLAGVGLVERCEFLTGLYAPQPFVARWQLSPSGQEIVGADLYDGRTGELVAPCPERRIPDALRDEIAEAARRTTPFRLPNGDRAWFDRRTVVFESADGTRETIPWPDGVRPGLAIGFGFHWLRDDGRRTGDVFDLTRRRTVHFPRPDSWLAFVRAGSWVFSSRHPASSHTERSYYPFDPDSDTWETWTRFAPVDGRIDALAGDGRLIVTTESDGAFLLDPDTGAREDLTVEHDGVLDAVGPADWHVFRTPARTPSGADVFRLTFRDADRNHTSTYARRDGARLVPCRVTAGYAQLFAIPDDDHVLVISGDNRTIERWRFGSDDAEVLFRVGRAQENVR